MRAPRLGSIAWMMGAWLAVLSVEGGLVECEPRGGLPNVFGRLGRGETVRVAYLGGSITDQEGWRPKSREWFRQQFPRADIREIHAAIGGTGSDLGVFRLRHDVLDQQPDLLFIEFAVNDSGAPAARIHRCMEGIVRQTWRANPLTDVCFVYTLAGGMLDTLESGELPTSQAAMERIADHYGIPSINFGVEVARLAQLGRLMFQGPQPKTDAEKAAIGERILFSPDGVHPYPDTGHALYLEALVRGMARIRPLGRPGPHPLPPPFTPDHWEAARMVSLATLPLGPAWRKLDPSTNSLAKTFRARLPGLWRANEAGATIEFRFRGTQAAIYDLVGPDCGQIKVSVDGGPEVVRPRFDAYCTYHRLATLEIAEGLSNTVHSVRLSLHPDQPDKARILARRNEKIDDPARFDDRAWYAGALLVVGEPVETKPAE